jgi:two-component system, chemotaxis family, response regulator Rcp1
MATGIKIAGRAVEILHVEDNEADATLFKMVMKKAGFPNHLNQVADGDEALLFLGRHKKYLQAPKPDVILLDLKLPKKDGLSVLNEIRQNESLKNIPVIILTGSESELDQSWATRLNANHYVVKPFDLVEFAGLVKLIREIWYKTFHKTA